MLIEAMTMPAEHDNTITRRAMLRRAGAGFGAIALAGLMHEQGLLAGAHAADASRINLDPRAPHHRPRAKAVIQLFQNGGPSQMDLFDPKPELARRAGQPHPEQVETFQLNNKNVIMPSPFTFRRFGRSGMTFSNLLPHLATCADDVCMIRSMHTGHNNHPQGIELMQSGRINPGFPSMGAWVCYALGSVNRNLPGYVALRDPEGYNTNGKLVWSSGWLPSLFAGTEFAAEGAAVHHLTRPEELPPRADRRRLALLNEMNRRHLDEHPGESDLETRIENFELAARMQLQAADLLDLRGESDAVKNRYGLDNPVTRPYGLRCLLARRLVEAGVRFVQVFPPLKPGFQPWDNHDNLPKDLATICSHIDQPSAALIDDLKQRGLLDETIVMWCGEFGRLPITENASGRDHNRHAFTLLMAGGGFRPGLTYGSTDDFGYRAVENRVSVHDLHATVLHQLGLDHTRLTHTHLGRPESLTDPAVTGATVVRDVLV